MERFYPEKEIEAIGRRLGINRIGNRAALLNIDPTRMFVDPAYPQCGGEMPELIAQLLRLPKRFR